MSILLFIPAKSHSGQCKVISSENDRFEHSQQNWCYDLHYDQKHDVHRDDFNKTMWSITYLNYINKIQLSSTESENIRAFQYVE